jgi:hypothetical protein
LAGSSVQELPIKAANIVATSSATERQLVTTEVVKAAIGMNPNAAVAIVSAVSSRNPAMAPAAAVAAATLQHKHIGLITKAAVAAAPSETGKIVAALLKEFPKDYQSIAIAAAENAPTSGREILVLVGDYVPALQGSIQAAIVGIAPDSANVPVQGILSQSSVAAAPSPTTPANPPVPSLSPPTLGPPFTPPPSVVVTVTPAQTTPEAPGSRKYSAP